LQDHAAAIAAHAHDGRAVWRADGVHLARGACGSVRLGVGGGTLRVAREV
jgi:hypothetical protein